MDPVKDTLHTLEKFASKSDSVLVSFSGGKDSLCVLDLCSRTFPRVECFFMHWAPYQRHLEEKLSAAGATTVHRVPHWAVAGCLNDGTYSFPLKNPIPEVGVIGMWAAVMADTGIPLVAVGGRKSDGVWRKRNRKTTECDDVFYPIWEWSKFDVLGYLARRGIKAPKAEQARGEAGGQDLSSKHLLWLFDNYPDDFSELERIFPFIGAVVKRREWYGQGQAED
jgi:phosphoadenosine phosphosulfate reductase